ncbi:MAG: hypothetical protein EOO90_22140 [Pedobacter sp.]|nr:MAG: hypothetical protein EOO90_22140 [Pedobacter sp.]
MFKKLLMVLAVAGLAITGCGNNENKDGKYADSPRVDTNLVQDTGSNDSLIMADTLTADTTRRQQ